MRQPVTCSATPPADAGLDLLGPALAAGADRIALIDRGRRYRYRDLDRRARQLAIRLQQRGLVPGDRVALLAANDIAYLDLLCAAPLTGIIVVPLNGRLGLDELRHAVALVRPALLLVDAEQQARGLALRLPTIRLGDYPAWLAVAGDDPQPARHRRGDDDLHLLLFTGGTTGTPKAVGLPYRQTLGNADDTVGAWDLKPDDRAIQCTPMFHAGAQVLSLPLLRVGGTVVLMPRFDPARYLQLATEHHVTLMFMVPTMYAALAADPGFDGCDLSAVRFAITGGAPCPASLRDRYVARGIGFRCGFGMTEAGVNCFTIDADDAERQPLAVGRPMPRVEIAIRRDDGSDAGVDEAGELWLRGPQVCAGYWGEPAGTGVEFRDGWLASGDYARRDASGLVSICGRRKDTYISGGENVHPFEVEAALTSCPGVAESCVFGWPDPRWGEVGIAFVVVEAGWPLDAGGLRQALRERLAGYKLPVAIHFVAALPRSPVGKVLRGAARAEYAARLQAQGRERAA